MSKAKETETKAINVELPADVHRLLKIACAAEGLNFSQAVTRAVKAWARGGS